VETHESPCRWKGSCTTPPVPPLWGGLTDLLVSQVGKSELIRLLVGQSQTSAEGQGSSSNLAFVPGSFPKTKESDTAKKFNPSSSPLVSGEGLGAVPTGGSQATVPSGSNRSASTTALDTGASLSGKSGVEFSPSSPPQSRPMLGGARVSFLDPPMARSPVTYPGGSVPTAGVDIETMEMRMGLKDRPANKTKVEFRLYDFAGTEIFYPTHQFFLGPRSVYVALFNLTDPDLGRLEYWMRTIRLIGRTELTLKPSVIIVGTHLDEIEKREANPTLYLGNMTATLARKFSNTIMLRNVVFTSIKSKKGLDDLRVAIQERAMQEVEVLSNSAPGAYVVRFLRLVCVCVYA